MDTHYCRWLVVLTVITLLALCTSPTLGDLRAVVLMLANPNIARPMLAPPHIAGPHGLDFIPRSPPSNRPLGLEASHLTSPVGGVDILATVDSKSVRDAIGLEDTTIDLSSIFQEEGLVDTLPPALLELARGFRGQYRRIPIAGGPDKLICNRTSLISSGWVPGDDWEIGKPLVEDLESFVSLLSRARAASVDKTPQLIIGQDTTHLATLLLLLMGGQKATTEVALGKLSLKSDLITQWLQALVLLRPEILVNANRAAIQQLIHGRVMCVYAPTSLLNTFPEFPENKGRLIFSTIPPPAGYSLIYSPGEWLRAPVTAVIVWALGVPDPYSSNNTRHLDYMRAVVQSEMKLYDSVTPSTPWAPGPFRMLVPSPKVVSLPPQFDHILSTSRILQSTEAMFSPFSAVAHPALATHFIALGQLLFQDIGGTLTSSKYGDPLPAFDIANYTDTLENIRLTEVLSVTPPPSIRPSEEHNGKTVVEIVPERPGDIIRYTIDGSPPSLTSPLYTQSLEFGRTGEVLVRATARRDGLGTSAEVSRVISLRGNSSSGTSTTVVTILVLLAVLVTIALMVALGLMARKWARLRRTKKALQLEAEAARVENENRLEALVNDLRNEISKREEAETLLKRESQFKSQFIGNMSHELRTPINGILLGAGLLGMSTLTEHQRSVVKTIDSSVALLLGLVNDILDAAKMDEGGLEPRYRFFDFVENVYRCVNILETRANDRAITLAVVIHPGTPRELMTDSDRLGQCLINLLTNAIKFTPRGGAVVLTVSYHRAWGVPRQPDCNLQPPSWFYDGVCAPVYPAQGDDEASTTAAESTSGKSRSGVRPPASTEYLGPPDPTGVLVVEVRDTGVGIPESAHQLLFQRFSQVDPSDSRSHGGSGLGLYISRELVQRLGGGIGVKTKSDVGSTFALWLPISVTGSDGSSTRTSSSAPLTPDVNMTAVLDRVIGQVKSRIGRKALIMVMLNDPIHSTIACMMMQNRWKSNVDLLEVHSSDAGTAARFGGSPSERKGSTGSSLEPSPFSTPVLSESTRNDFAFPPWPVNPKPIAAPLGKLCTTVTIRAQSLPAALKSCKQQVDMLPSVIILAEDLLGSEDLTMFQDNYLNDTGPYLILAKPSMKQSRLETLSTEQSTEFASVIRSIDLPLQEEHLFSALDTCLSTWADRELQRATTTSQLRRLNSDQSNRMGHAIPPLYHSASHSAVTSPSGLGRRYLVEGKGITTPRAGEDSDEYDHAESDARIDAVLLKVAENDEGQGTSDTPSDTGSDSGSDIPNGGGNDDDDDGDGDGDGDATDVLPKRGGMSSFIESSTALTTLTSHEIKAGLESYRKARAVQTKKDEGSASHGISHGGETEGPRPMRVLLAEDNVVNAKLLIKVLNRFNADVTHAWNGEEAYKMYKNASVPFDVILMDLQMPLCTGQESTILIRAYEAQQSIHPVLLYALTATTLGEDLREFLYEAGFDGLYSKPLMIPTVKKMMEDLRRKIPEMQNPAAT